MASNLSPLLTTTPPLRKPNNITGQQSGENGILCSPLQFSRGHSRSFPKTRLSSQPSDPPTRMVAKLNGILTKASLIGLGLGQFVSLLITSTGFTSSVLARRGINAPTSQSFANYVLLAIVYGVLILYRRKPLQMKWYYYLILGLVDVEANYLVVKAYQYTSLTSVMLLDCWTIPMVIFLTWMFLNTKYKFRKFVGVAICVAGLVLVIFSDVHASDREGGSNPVKGDLLVIAGSMLYAVTNVSEEFLVKNGDRVELMSMLGLFGAIVSAGQIGIFERNELASIHWTTSAVLPFVGYALAMFVFYSTVPFVLKMSGSTMLNLSLLTSDMWAVLIRIFAYHEKVDWMYFIAFVGVAVGLVIYSGSAREEAAVSDVAEGDVAGKERDEEAALDGLVQGSAASGSTSTGDGKHHSALTDLPT